MLALLLLLLPLVRAHISAHIQRALLDLDRLQSLDYGQPCASLAEERERHDLNDLVALVIRTPTEDLLTQITSRQQALVIQAKPMCNYTKGLACSHSSLCTCYTGHRHGDIWYEPTRENGSCKLDEMSRCYSPSYLVSRGATVIPCVSGARCVGELTGGRCISPMLTENCHCQRPCPDGTFSNMAEELRKCVSKLEEISVLGFGDNCSLADQADRDEVMGSMGRDERAGPIIRRIKRLLATSRLLCSPALHLTCQDGLCACGPEGDGVLFSRGDNDTCLWAKGSRCDNSSALCVPGTACLREDGQPCDQQHCLCTDPDELGGGGTVALALCALLLAAAALAYLVYAKKLPCLGASPANV